MRRARRSRRHEVVGTNLHKLHSAPIKVGRVSVKGCLGQIASYPSIRLLDWEHIETLAVHNVACVPGRVSPESDRYRHLGNQVDSQTLGGSEEQLQTIRHAS